MKADSRCYCCIIWCMTIEAEAELTSHCTGASHRVRKSERAVGRCIVRMGDTHSESTPIFDKLLALSNGF